MADGNQPLVFTIPVIWDTLGKYLTLSDFFNLRRVNSKIKSQVDDCLHFQEKCWQNVWMVTSDAGQCFPQHNYAIKCRNIGIYFVTSNSEKIVNVIALPRTSLINKNTRGLKFSLLVEGSSYTASSSIDTHSMNRSIQSIISPIKTLYTLKINSFLLGSIKTDTILNDLSRMKSLVVFCPASAKRGMTSLEMQQLTENINFISGKIQSFREFTVGGLKNATALLPGVSTIFTKSVSHLTFLDLRLPTIWPMLNDSAQISFPCLKTLKIKALYSDSREVVASFLKNQPLLEHLNISWDLFPRAVYDIISERSGALKVFHVKGKSFGPHEVAGDWNFLRHMEGLQEFLMKCPFSSPRDLVPIASFNQIIELLPKHSLKKLYLRGLSGPTAIDTQCLEEFSNLKELSLLRCRSAVTDNTLKSIATNARFQRSLEVLEISLCDDLTNYGITGDVISGTGRGRRKRNAGFSLCFLSALRKLTIKSCEKITDASLNKLCFPKLQYLDVSHNRKVLRTGALTAAKQNQSLETFVSSWRIDREFNSYLDSINDGSRKINLRHCFNSSDKGGQNDSDSDAEHANYASDDSDDYCYSYADYVNYASDESDDYCYSDSDLDY